MLFGVPAVKDAEGSQAWNPDGIAQQAIAALRVELGDDHVVMGDLCLDEYTDHGHCGVLTPDGDVDNDATLERYRRIAVAQADAGAHMVGPSGMMDGQVAAIRDALDAAGHQRGGDHRVCGQVRKRVLRAVPRRRRVRAPRSAIARATRWTPPTSRKRSARSAPTSMRAPTSSMVKPALPYLDIVRAAKDATGFPMAAYHVSGEYAMLKAAAA